MEKRIIRIGILLAGTLPPQIVKQYGNYEAQFNRLLKKAIEIGNKNIILEVKGYEIQKLEFPNSEELLELDGLIISGSVFSAYEDIPWINRLVNFTKFIIEEHIKVKLIGVCFGHQIVARAMGGQVVKNPMGWEVAVTEVLVTKAGKKFFNTNKEFLRVQEMHQDHVSLIPPNFINLGYTEKSPVQGMLKENHVFTIQGHPEFVNEMVREMIQFRYEIGIFDSDSAQMYLKNADLDDDNILIGQKFIEFLTSK
ncbi:4493_t:CDS:2 [Diversispora eburnea]|uniref:4493_t:CDS:1 n=1 Tax=Diversispora eburnea TaxID=1213867 RepID=A0A9N9AGM6_9GLOM|nr:4493_t:CDS:2 [Diversispora eburnea]